jgi:hypothetical protein
LVLDGEVVAFEHGVTSLSRLQTRMQIRDPDDARNSGIAVYYYVFDVLQVEGRAVEELPQRERKRLVRRAPSRQNPLRYSAHRNESGEEYLQRACESGWEGLIAKQATAPYAHGRSRKWLKFKCVREQELVIGGFTDPRGSRRGFGALLVGYCSWASSDTQARSAPASTVARWSRYATAWPSSSVARRHLQVTICPSAAFTGSSPGSSVSLASRDGQPNTDSGIPAYSACGGTRTLAT